jgi:hypothetical protein
VHTAWPLSPLSCSTRHEYAFAIAATLYGSNRTLGTCWWWWWVPSFIQTQEAERPSLDKQLQELYPALAGL